MRRNFSYLKVHFAVNNRATVIFFESQERLLKDLERKEVGCLGIAMRQLTRVFRHVWYSNPRIKIQGSPNWGKWHFWRILFVHVVRLFGTTRNSGTKFYETELVNGRISDCCIELTNFTRVWVIRDAKQLSRNFSRSLLIERCRLDRWRPTILPIMTIINIIILHDNSVL